METATELGKRLNTTLRDVQTINGADDSYLYSALAIDGPGQASEIFSSRLRTLIIVAVAGALLLFVSVSVARSVELARARRPVVEKPAKHVDRDADGIAGLSRHPRSRERAPSGRPPCERLAGEPSWSYRQVTEPDSGASAHHEYGSPLTREQTGPPVSGRGRAVREDLGELGQPVGPGGFRRRKRLAGAAERDGTVPGGRNPQHGSVRRYRAGAAGCGPTARRRCVSPAVRVGKGLDPRAQQFRHRQRQLLGVGGDPGREAQRPGLPVGHCQRRGGPDMRVAAAAVAQGLQQFRFAQAAGRGQHELVQHTAVDRVDMDTQDIGVQPCQRLREFLQRTGPVLQHRAGPPQGRCRAEPATVPQRGGVQQVRSIRVAEGSATQMTRMVAVSVRTRTLAA